jgi:hypothetical protein
VEKSTPVNGTAISTLFGAAVEHHQRMRMMNSMMSKNLRHFHNHV